MKIYSLLPLLFSSLLASNALAEESSFIKGKDDFVTNACYVAATEGMDAVKVMVEKRNLSFREFKKDVACNKMPIAEFAAQYANKKEPKDKVELVAENNNLESQVCIAALTESLADIRKRFKVNPDYIRCNQLKLTRFVEKYKEQAQTPQSGD